MSGYHVLIFVAVSVSTFNALFLGKLIQQLFNKNYKGHGLPTDL